MTAKANNDRRQMTPHRLLQRTRRAAVMAAVVATGLLILPWAPARAADAAAPPSDAAGTPPSDAAGTPHDNGGAPSAGPDIRVQVVSRMNTTISAPMSGQLDSFPLRDGDRFEKGAVLAHFVCAEQQGALAHARAVLEEKRQVLATNSKLHQLGTGSGLDYHVALAQVAEAAADLQTATALVRECTVTAPFSGRVGGVAAHDYQYLSVGSPLLDILEDRALRLELIVPSRWLAWLRPGAGFTVSIDETGHTYQARLTRLSGRVDPVSQSIKAYARLVDASPDLLPGMSGRATFKLPAR